MIMHLNLKRFEGKLWVSLNNENGINKVMLSVDKHINWIV